jgi:FlaA1/EpsC-like NDP-sugar epimerase
MTANQNGNYAGKVAFVTGAGGSIGRATGVKIAPGRTAAYIEDATKYSIFRRR